MDDIEFKITTAETAMHFDPYQAMAVYINGKDFIDFYENYITSMGNFCAPGHQYLRLSTLKQNLMYRESYEEETDYDYYLDYTGEKVVGICECGCDACDDVVIHVYEKDDVIIWKIPDGNGKEYGCAFTFEKQSYIDKVNAILE